MPTVSFNQHFPGYEILGELGRSNARVLKARRHETGDLVAIKHFSFNTDSDTLHRFQRESEIMTSIKHPNIVRIREVQLDAELPYIVMDLAEGGDLRSLLKERGKLNAADTIRLGLQMADAFKAIHQQDIIHRDIKPENIMYRLLPSGELHFLLTDFGIAKLREQPATVTGQSLMTYEYASPEQFDDPKSVTSATDYYSLGVVLYECISGKVPFPLSDGRVHALMNNVINTAPPVLDLKKGYLPRSLRSLVELLLAKKPVERVRDELTLKKYLKRADIEELDDEETVVSNKAVLPVTHAKQPAAISTQTAPVKKVAPAPPRKSTGSRGLIGLIAIIIAGSIVLIIYKQIKTAWQKAPAEITVSDSSLSPADSTATATGNESSNKPDLLKALNYDNGNYVGEVLNNRMHGFGTYYWNDGSKYVGQWVDGNRNGKGVLTLPNGDQYDGEWKDDLKNGTGSFTWKMGDRYEGNWINDVKEGAGTYYFAKGDRYVGEWFNGKMHGNGTLYFAATGTKYIGEWMNDKMHGRGTMYQPDGSYENGRWENGYRVETFK
jgi:serine/threonine protein kinase